MRALPVAAGIAAIVLLAGCAQPGAEAPEAPTAAPTSQAPSPSAEPTPSATVADPHADWQRIETPNGTASFLIPPGWAAEIGGQELEHDGEIHWQNEIVVLDPDGEAQLGYSDGPGGDDVAAIARVGIVELRPVATLDDEERAAAAGDVADPAYLEHAVAAWWVDWGDQGIRGIVSLTPDSVEAAGGHQPGFLVLDGERGLSFGTMRAFSTDAEAAAWLESDEVAQLVDIVATLDLTGIPAPALPGD